MNCTVVANQVSVHPFGGGLYSAAGAGAGPIIKNSIFANNAAPADVDGPDIFGNVQSQDYNLIKNTNGYVLSGRVGHNITNQDPVLDSLTNSSGDTQTHALQSGSPAIDTGSCTGVASDQRGIARPQGVACDIGAYEFPQPNLTLTKTVDNETPQAGERITYTIVVENSGAQHATGALISDTLPDGLTFAGPVTLDPPGAGNTAPPPTLASDLTITAGKRITVSVPVAVNNGLDADTIITNTAAITSIETPAPHADSQAIIVVEIIPPKLIAATPVNGAEEIDLDAPVVITFSKAISTTSLAYTIAPDPGGWAELWNSEGTVVTLTHSPFARQTTYTVTITAANGAEDVPFYGAPYTWHLTTLSYPHLTLTKIVDNDTPQAGERITYTIVVENSSAQNGTGALISDTLPNSLTLAGPVTLDPPGAGIAGAAPILARGLTITSGERITVSFPVTVNNGLNADAIITNTAAVTCTEVLTPHVGSRTITVVDATPPAIVTVAPINGTMDLILTAPVVITFSETISTSSLAYTVAPDLGGWAKLWDSNGMVVTLTHPPFVYQATYTVTVTAATDAEGAPISGTPYTWHFTTMPYPYKMYMPLVMRDSL